jgi:hypothetical protein
LVEINAFEISSFGLVRHSLTCVTRLPNTLATVYQSRVSQRRLTMYGKEYFTRLKYTSLSTSSYQNTYIIPENNGGGCDLLTILSVVVRLREDNKGLGLN